MARRADYALGKAIRDGQASGAVRTNKEGRSHFGSTGPADPKPATVNSFATNAELYGDGAPGGNGVLAMADNATPDEFDQALASVERRTVRLPAP